MTNAQDVIVRYLQDAIAAEQSSESQMREFAKTRSDPEGQAIFTRHVDETMAHRQDLERRLHLLNARPSVMKGWMTSLFGTAPRAVQVGHDEGGKAAQNLIMAFAAENTEIAMYEALAMAAHEAGDAVTEKLARQIQEEEKQMAERVFALLPGVTGQSVTGQSVTGQGLRD